MTMQHDTRESHTKFERLLLLWELGLVDESVDRWMREHVERCDACAALLDPAQTIDPDAPEDDLATEGAVGHLAPAMIAAWDHARTKLQGLERRLVARHLARCKSCRRDLVFLGHEPSLAAGSPDPVGDDVDQITWIFRLTQLVDRLTELAVVEPLPVQVMRSAPSDPVEALRLRGLEAYAANMLGDAEDYLSETATQGNDAEAWLYLGSVHLLRARPAAAVAALRKALDRAQNDAVAGEARWQLANAALTAGEAHLAVTALATLVSEGGSRSADARALLMALKRAAERGE